MKIFLFFLLLFVLGITTFLLSGFIANAAYSLIGCLYTSSGIFGVSFITISAIAIFLFSMNV